MNKFLVNHGKTSGSKPEEGAALINKRYCPQHLFLGQGAEVNEGAYSNHQ
jgi:hypothetical protein